MDLNATSAVDGTPAAITVNGALTAGGSVALDADGESAVAAENTSVAVIVNAQVIAGGDLSLTSNVADTTNDVANVDVNAAIVSRAGDIDVDATNDAMFSANVIARGEDGGGSINMSDVLVNILVESNVAFTSRGTINLRSTAAAGRLLSDADGTTETLFLDTGETVPLGGTVAIGNVGPADNATQDQFVNLVFGQNMRDDTLSLSGALNLDDDANIAGTVASLDVRILRDVVLETNAGNSATVINTNGGNVLFTGTPLNGATTATESLAINAGDGTVEMGSIGTDTVLEPSGIVTIGGVPLLGQEINAGEVFLTGDLTNQDGDVEINADAGITVVGDLTIINLGAGDVDIDGSDVNGNQNILINAGEGDVNIRDVGQVERVASLTIIAGGTTNLLQSDISATGNVDLSAATDVDLAGALNVDSTSGNILLNGGAIDGAFDMNLTAAGGDVSIGSFGQTTPIGDLTVRAQNIYLTGTQTAAGNVDITALSSRIIVSSILTVLGTSEIDMEVNDADGGQLALMAGSVIRTTNGNVHFRVPFNNLITRGDVAAGGGGFEFLNLIGAASFDFDADEIQFGMIPMALYDAFVNSDIFGQFIDSSLQWKECLIPAGAIRAETSAVVFDEEED